LAFMISLFRRQRFQRWDTRWHSWVILALAILSFSLAVFWGQIPASSEVPQLPTTPLEQQVQRGNQLYQNRQYEAAVTVWQTLATALQHDPLNQAMAWSNLSLTYQQMGQWQKAEQAITQSLTILNGLSSSSSERDRLLAAALDIQGRLYLFKGQPQQALTVWQESQKLHQKLGNLANIIQNRINQAQALQFLGNQLLAQKILTQIQTQLEQTAEIDLKITGLRSLGNVWRQLGDLKVARETLLQAKQLAQVSKTPQVELEILLDLGNLAYADARRQASFAQVTAAGISAKEAHQYFQQVAQQATQPDLRLQALMNDIDLLTAESMLKLLPQEQPSPKAQRLAIALQHYAQLPEQIEALPVGDFSVQSRLRSVKLGINLMQQGASIPSRSLLLQAQTALKQAQQLQNDRAEAQALKTLGELYLKQQQWQDAQKITERALAITLQHLNSPDLLYELQWQLGQIATQLHPDQPERAIAYYQNAIKALDQVRLQLMPASPDTQFSFRDQVAPVYRQLVELLLQQPTPEHLKQSVEYIDALQIAELENFLRCPIPVQELLTQINDPTAATIYTIFLPKQVAIILQLPGQLGHQVSLVSQEKLKGNLAALRGALSKGENSLKVEALAKQQYIYRVSSTSRKELEKNLANLQEALSKEEDNPKVEALAKQIYNAILKPISKELEQSQVETLIIASDGLLRNIPFSVLHDGKDYLLNSKYTIVVAPKLKLFEPKPTPAKLNVLTGGVSEAQPILIDGEMREFVPIQGVEPELLGIQTSAIVKSGRPLLNAEFTVSNLEKQLQSQLFSAIHLKTHGSFSADPRETYILAYRRLIESSVFGELIELASRNKANPLELLVLSSCYSAKGDDRAVLGLAGIAARGARSVIASLWEARDEVNTKLMTAFYQELAKPNVTKAKALKQAQQLIYQEDARPFTWASYVLVGNWQ
jgi:CHAT domain-containing protein